jgi:hypothetical protein
MALRELQAGPDVRLREVRSPELRLRELRSGPDRAVVLVDERRSLLAVTNVLIRQAHPRLSAGAVILCVRRCRDELVRSGVRAGLASAVEDMARARLGLPSAAA